MNVVYCSLTINDHKTSKIVLCCLDCYRIKMTKCSPFPLPIINNTEYYTN